MMRDEAVAAADVEHVGLRREHAGDLERHVVSATNLAAPSHALEAAFECCSQTRHWPRLSASPVPRSRKATIQQNT